MSSKRAIRRKECGGKVRYESAGAAAYVVGQMRRAGKVDGRMNVYSCKFCKGYHFGHAPHQAAA